MENYNHIPELDKSRFFRPGEDVYTHISIASKEYDNVVHKHKFIEMAYVISGSGIHYVGGLKYPVSKGDLVIVDYGVPHGFFFQPDSEENFVTYDLLFTPSFLGIDNGDEHFKALSQSFLFQTFKDSPLFNTELKLINNTSHNEFYELFNKIYAEYENRNYGYLEIIRSDLIELISKIFRKLNKKSNEKFSTENRHKYVEKAITFLKANYNSPINIKNIVEDIFLSKDYFRQLFKETTGQSITSYIQQTRIEQACMMLTTTDRSISDISVCCGYNDTKFFYSTFKKIKGVTPGEYRKNHSS